MLDNVRVNERTTMREGKEQKCCRCGTNENLHKSNGTGSMICRSCNTARCRAYRANGGMQKQAEAVRRYNAKNKQRVRAWSSVHYHLTKQPCEICGSNQVHAHHDRPEMTLDVIWLCPAHHKERHRYLKSLEGVAA